MDITGNTVFIPARPAGIGLALALALNERGNKWSSVAGGSRCWSRSPSSTRRFHVQIDTADAGSIEAAAKECWPRTRR